MISEKPIVSVIIPAYNAEKFITETLVCLISQTLQSWEAIIVNDGSNDKTQEIVQAYSEKDDRIMLINQSNKGCSAAKNIGLANAKGEFIQYLDADDLLSPDKLEAQVEALLLNPNSVAVCKTIVFSKQIDGADTYELDSDFLYSTGDTINFLLNLYGLNGKYGMIQPNAFLISKQLADKAGIWNIEISPSPDEDGEYFCRIISSANEMIYTKGINYYRKSTTGTSLSKGRGLRFSEGAIKSTIAKFQHLLKNNNSIQIRKLYAENLSSCYYVYAYPYDELYDLVLKEIKALGYKSFPLKGGSNFNTIARFIGYKHAIKLKRLFEKG